MNKRDFDFLIYVYNVHLSNKNTILDSENKSDSIKKLHKIFSKISTNKIDFMSRLINKHDITAKLKYSYTSNKIDLLNLENYTDRMTIIKKIIPAQLHHMSDIKQILESYAGSQTNANKWSCARSVKKTLQKNHRLIKFIPKNISSYIDLGCGDGLDLNILGDKFNVNIKDRYCADIVDHRNDSNKTKSNFIKINLGSEINLPSESIDLITAFFVIHHSVDIEFRLKDLIRLLKPGALLIIRDHDIMSKIDAENVDFEHMVYDIGNSNKPIDYISSNYDILEPMYYYSASDIINFLTEHNMKKLFIDKVNNITKVYSGVFMKI